MDRGRRHVNKVNNTANEILYHKESTTIFPKIKIEPQQLIIIQAHRLVIVQVHQLMILYSFQMIHSYKLSFNQPSGIAPAREMPSFLQWKTMEEYYPAVLSTYNPSKLYYPVLWWRDWSPAALIVVVEVQSYDLNLVYRRLQSYDLSSVYCANSCRLP